MGGLFFLRVNSATTNIYYKHRTVEREFGGFTIRYENCPKRDLDIHFFSRAELLDIFADMGFEIISGPYERSELRKPPKTGSWSQWEVAMKKHKDFKQ